MAGRRAVRGKVVPGFSPQGSISGLKPKTAFSYHSRRTP